jgi:hypothetical protein
MTDTSIVQDIPVKIEGVLIVQITGTGTNAQKMIETIGAALMKLIASSGFVTSVQGLSIEEIQIPPVSGRLQ